MVLSYLGDRKLIIADNAFSSDPCPVRQGAVGLNPSSSILDYVYVGLEHLSSIISADDSN